jgi:hypothetical protein
MNPDISDKPALLCCARQLAWILKGIARSSSDRRLDKGSGRWRQGVDGHVMEGIISALVARMFGFDRSELLVGEFVGSLIGRRWLLRALA